MCVATYYTFEDLRMRDESWPESLANLKLSQKASFAGPKSIHRRTNTPNSKLRYSTIQTVLPYSKCATPELCFFYVNVGGKSFSWVLTFAAHNRAEFFFILCF